MEELETAFNTNKPEIVNRIEQIEQMESKPNAPTGGLDEDAIWNRLRNYEAPNVGFGGVERHVANLYLF
jgi:hypothetical protein